LKREEKKKIIKCKKRKKRRTKETEYTYITTNREGITAIEREIDVS